MRRSVGAYLSDVLDACDSIESILSDVDLETHLFTREKRSAVERSSSSSARPLQRCAVRRRNSLKASPTPGNTPQNPVAARHAR